MFGHAAPVIPGRNAPAPAPAPQQPPGGGFAPPQQQGFPPAQQAGQPARTVMGQSPNFGQQPAPQQPGRPPQGGPQPGFPPPGQPPGFGGPPPGQPPPNQFGGPPPGQPGFPPPPNQFGGPPPGQPNQFGGPPPGQPGFPPPPNQFGGPPPGQPGFPPPGQPPGFGGPPPGQPGFPPPPNQFGGPPPGQPGFPNPGQPGFPPPPNQFGGPPQPGFAPPAPGGGFAPPPPQYPPAGGFGIAPQQDLPGPLDNIARGLPQSAPGTILGIPVSRLRDVGLQRMVLFMAGIALLASIVVPLKTGPLAFPFSSGVSKWALLIFPIIAGAAYLLVSAAPPHIRQKVPPVVIQWIPFGISVWGVFTMAPALFSAFGPLILAAGGGGEAAAAGAAGIPMPGGLYGFAYALLLFGLLARIAKPTDQTARVIIAIGAGLLILSLIGLISPTFKFSDQPVLFIVYKLLAFIITALGGACILFVVPPQKLPPALQAVDAFGPLIAAALIAWLVIGPLLIMLGVLIDGQPVTALLNFARVLLFVVAFIGVLMMASPSVYDSLFEIPMMRRTQLSALLHCMLVPLFGVLWLVETKEGLKKRTGMPLPSGWWIAVPFGAFYFLWKWAEGVEKATGYSKMNAFLLTAFVAPAGIWITQGKFNQLEGGAIQGGPPQPMAPMQPGGFPGQGGGYPPPGGGYPPPGGGYPPPGGGYPPPGGQYPA